MGKVIYGTAFVASTLFTMLLIISLFDDFDPDKRAMHGVAYRLRFWRRIAEHAHREIVLAQNDFDTICDGKVS